MIVLITSCQVSEKLNIGPLKAQKIIKNKANKKAFGEPTAFETLPAILWNILFMLKYNILPSLIFNTSVTPLFVHPKIWKYTKQGNET